MTSNPSGFSSWVLYAADGTHVGHTVTSLFTKLFGFDVVVKLQLFAIHGYNPR